MSGNFPFTPEQQKADDILRAQGQVMMAAIDKAIIDATARAAENLHAVDFRSRMPEQAYFSAIALEALFVKQCAGNPETLEGGDARLAGRILDNLHNVVARHWENRNAEPADSGAAGRADLSDDGMQVAGAAERLALKTVIQVLVDHASKTDGGLRASAIDRTDADITKMMPQSEMERSFAEHARAYVEILVRPDGT